MRKIMVITGSRAEYGLLYWIIKEMHDDPGIELQLVVTGMHLSHEFGHTVEEIERDFPVSEKIEMLLSSDSETGISMSMGIGMIGFAKAFERLRPDILLVLGDRFEIFAAVAAAVPFGITVAHIHGGETTEGAMDELFRHAITKMSHMHFPANEKYKMRIMQMGEPSQNVFCYGAPGLDNIYKLRLYNKKELINRLGLPEDKKFAAFTYNPVTLGNASAALQISEILAAIKKHSDIYWVFTYPNADTKGRVIIDKINAFAKKYPQKGKVVVSLGQLKYLSLLGNAALMLGNSSSGIIEAPSFELPVVNIGDRQAGRIQAGNVINVQCKRELIAKAIKKALSEDFRDSLKGLKNPYGEGNTSIKIVEKLRQIDINAINKKRFYDLKLRKDT